MSILIGLGYRMRMGKDTAAQAIINAYKSKYDIRRYAFGDALKEEYVEACREAGSAFALIQGMRVTHNLPNWVQYEFDAPKDDPICGEWGKQRSLLQFWGTEYRRTQDPLYWVKKLASKIDRELPQFAVITDVRFPNEGAFIKMCGGFTVKVTREGHSGEASHQSETIMDSYPFDFELCGQDGNKEGLERLAIGWFDWLLNNLDPKPTAIGEFNATRITA